MKVIHFWETKESLQSYTIQELEKKFHFSYLSTIDFKDPKIKQILQEQGNRRFIEGNVSEQYIAQGKRWKEHIKQGFLAPSHIRLVDEDVGYGLFAQEDLPEGSFVGEYAGIVRENNDHTWISNYLYSYPLLDEIGRNYVIDAHSGSLTRFINHSYKPNLQATYGFVDGFFHMILLTILPIKKGTQFTYNYGKNYWYIRSQPKELEL